MCISKHYKSLLKFHTNSKSIIETNKKGGVGNYLLPHFSWVFCALFVYYFTKWFLNWQWYIIFWNGYWNSMQNESMPPLYNKLQFTHLSLLAMFSHQYLQTRFLLIFVSLIQISSIWHNVLVYISVAYSPHEVGYDYKLVL